MAAPRPAPTPLRVTDPADWPALMARAQAGEPDAYRALLDGITPYLRVLARRALREAADVEDVVQDILLTVHVVRHTYDPARPFRPWITGIARHRIIDRLRARGRVLAREIPLDLAHETLAADDAPAGDSLDHRALRAGLAALPERQRQAVVMLKLRELSLHQASAVTGQSIGALKVATHRAMAALRRMFGAGDGVS